MVEKKQFPPKQNIPAYLKPFNFDNDDKEELLQEAKKDLEKLSSVDRIHKWLTKLPESIHGQLENWYRRKYPEGKFWTIAETKYQKMKEEKERKANELLQVHRQLYRKRFKQDYYIEPDRKKIIEVREKTF